MLSKLIKQNKFIKSGGGAHRPTARATASWSGHCADAADTAAANGV
jgi:hypothetical protein